MNGTSPAEHDEQHARHPSLSDPIIKLDNVHLTLTSGPAPCISCAACLWRYRADSRRRSSGHRGPEDLAVNADGRARADDRRPDHGLGPSIGPLSEDELAVLRGSEMGIVFQSFHLVPTMTALENVALPMELAGDGKAFDTARGLGWTKSDLRRASITFRRSFPAASSSALPLRGHSAGHLNYFCRRADRQSRWAYGPADRRFAFRPPSAPQRDARDRDPRQQAGGDDRSRYPDVGWIDRIR